MTRAAVLRSPEVFYSPVKRIKKTKRLLIHTEARESEVRLEAVKLLEAPTGHRGWWYPEADQGGSDGGFPPNIRLHVPLKSPQDSPVHAPGRQKPPML